MEDDSESTGKEFTLYQPILLPDPQATADDSYGESESGWKYRTDLKRDLKERHVNMITFTACIGVGLFLQSGQIIFLAGPGLAVIVYLLSGSFVWAALGSLGEMSALFPMTGGIFLFPARFLDQGVGYAAGWLSWFSWTVIIASEVLAAAQLFDFQFDPAYLKSVGYPDTSLEWGFGRSTSPLVWVGIGLVFILLPNCLPVRWYGRLEYFFGCVKITFIVGLILLNVILSGLQRVKHPHGVFWTYDGEYSFASQNVTLRMISNGTDNNSTDATYQVLSGSPGVFLGMWSALTTVLFSMIGFETVSITAGENKDLRTAETIKIATRKICIRIIVLYALCCFCVGLNVPYTDPYLRNLNENSVRSGQNSIFMLALVRNHIRGLPHFFNAFFIFSALTSGMNSLYLSSRILHALAQTEDVWPAPKPRYYLITELKRNLARTNAGVPHCAIFFSWLFGFLAFLAAIPNYSSTVSYKSIELGRLATNSIVSMLLVYSTLCITFLKFHKAIDRAAKGQDNNINHGALSAYDRYHRDYPYRTHGQRGRAIYGLIGIVLVILLNGWKTFVSPFSGPDFVASYIGIPIFFLLVVLYHIKLEGWNPRYWTMRASNELQQPRPIVIANKDRRGVLRLSDNGVTRRNLQEFVEWIWVWLK